MISKLYQHLFPEKALRIIKDSLDTIVPTPSMSPEEVRNYRQQIIDYIETAIESCNVPAYSNAQISIKSLVNRLKVSIESSRRANKIDECKISESILSELEDITTQLALIATKKSPRKLANP